MRHHSPLLAIDEILFPYSGHIWFKQYNPNKPANMAYCTKVSAILQYLTPTIAYYVLVNQRKFKVQLQSIRSLELTSIPNISLKSCLYTATFKGSNISMDCYFTSVFLATWALEKNITIAGTMKHEFKSVADREERSVMRFYNTKGKIRLVSYIDKKKSGKNNLIVLSTIHNNVKITKDQWKKPSVQTVYDPSKGGIDVVDLLLTTHSTWIKSRK